MGLGTGGPDELIGQVVGGYQLVRRVGVGSIGVVFEGRRVADSPVLPQRAAIKVLSVPWQFVDQEREEFRERFRREAAILKGLRHPNIVRLYDFGEFGQLMYMVLEYVDGGTLDDRLPPLRPNAPQSRRPLALPDALRILQQLASALDEAHRQEVIHRDVKPTNILMDAQGNVHLTDFSVAHLVNEATAHLTHTGQQIGTKGFMAPEQVRGERNVGPQADVYSLGAVLYLMVTGRLPDDEKITIQLPNGQVGERFRAPRSLRSELPEPASAAILTALAAQPESRFPSAGTLAIAFDAGLQNHYADGVLPDEMAGALTINRQLPATEVVSARPTQPPSATQVTPRTAIIAGTSLLVAVTLLAALLIGINAGRGGTTGPGSRVTVFAPTNTSYPPTSTVAPGQPTNTPYPPTSTPLPPAVATFTPTPTPTDTPTPTPTPTPTQTPTPQPQPVNAYSNYGTSNWVGHAMCRGNPGNSLSLPGGTASQTFAVPSGVASLSSALMQIDPDATVTAQLSVAVNGTVAATATAAAAGDTHFAFGPVLVRAGDTITLSVTFSATSGKIITVYTVGSPGGTFTASNSCPDGAPNVSTTSTGLRAMVSGMS